MSNLCRRILGSCIEAASLFVASIGSTAFASDCPLIAESCACQSDLLRFNPTRGSGRPSSEPRPNRLP